MSERRRFGGPNAVRGCPGWYYGLMLHASRDDLGTRQLFEVFNPDTGGRRANLEASRYRTTTLARKMGDKRRGHQHVAQQAIRSRS